MAHLSPLPPVTSANWDWQMKAACRGLGPEYFYGTQSGNDHRLRERAAKAVCAECPVIETCLAWALSTKESWGVWGGLTVNERIRLGVAAVHR
jgi:WhiB family transcriptional regulator, redox-sensing transcriptional regulator